MLDLAPGYIAAIATQIGFLSAFLGGFAATLLCMLLTAGTGKRAAFVSIVLAAFSGIAFIVAVTATTQIVATAHPEAPAMAVKPSIEISRIMMSAGFMLGVLGLLACIGSAGWIRSRATGIATSVIAALGAFGVALALAAVTV